MVIEVAAPPTSHLHVSSADLRKDAVKLSKLLANAVDERLGKPLKHFLKAANDAGGVEAVGIGLIREDESTIVSLYGFLDYDADVRRIENGAIIRLSHEITLLQDALRPNDWITAELAFIDTRGEMADAIMQERLVSALNRAGGSPVYAILAVSPERR